jgi:hypothetical protein
MIWQRHNERYQNDDREMVERPGVYIVERPTVYAAYTEPHDGGARIERRFNYPGSLPPTFGLTPENYRRARWPAVRLHLPFRMGDEAGADKFVADLQTFVDNWLNANP